MSGHIFTSESVSEGHPDKVCDQISDAVLDNALNQDAASRVACETFTTTGLVLVGGDARILASTGHRHVPDPEPHQGPLAGIVTRGDIVMRKMPRLVARLVGETPKSIPGHEFAGEVAAVGHDVIRFEIGDRVSAEGHITCGVCRNCRAGRRHLCMNTVGVGVNRPGAFAEYIAVPAFNVFKLPDAITDEMASILDPLGNATHTALSFDLVGEDVLITGAGPIGIMATAIARYAGARHVVITDVNDYRLELARRMGASMALNVTRESIDGAMQELGMVEETVTVTNQEDRVVLALVHLYVVEKRGGTD